jgi:hypothetical protein
MGLAHFDDLQEAIDQYAISRPSATVHVFSAGGMTIPVFPPGVEPNTLFDGFGHLFPKKDWTAAARRGILAGFHRRPGRGPGRRPLASCLLGIEFAAISGTYVASRMIHCPLK